MIDILSKMNFFEKLFQEYNYDKCLKRFEKDLAQHSVGSDLGPNCLQ